MPEIPPLSGTAGLKASTTTHTPAANLVGAVASVFGRDGAIARHVSNFEPRAGQVEMAAAVARVFEHGGVLLAEAGTGTGKTLAYLVPAILSRQRVLISTGTKNLQEQIFSRTCPRCVTRWASRSLPPA